MHLRLRHLEAFRTLARTRSFSEAAELLHETQSALSKQIKELETQLGVRLLDRTTRRMTLSAEGRAFLISCERLMDTFDLSVREVRDLAQGKRGRLSIAVTPHLAATLLPPTLARYLAANPLVEVVCHDVPADEIPRRIAGGDAEFGITAFDPAEGAPPGLVVTRLHERQEELVVVMPHGHPLEQLHSVRWESLRDHALVMLRPGQSAHTVFETARRARQVELQARLEATTVATVLGMVAAGIGVAVFPRSTIGEADGLPWRRIAGARIPRRLLLLRIAGRGLSGPARAFLRLLQEALAATPAEARSRIPVPATPRAGFASGQ